MSDLDRLMESIASWVRPESIRLHPATKDEVIVLGLKARPVSMVGSPFQATPWTFGGLALVSDPDMPRNQARIISTTGQVIEIVNLGEGEKA